MAEKKTKQDIEAMSERERTYESLLNTYNKQKESSNAAYDKEISNQANSMLSKGMQRSSFGEQIRANLANQKIKAANDIDSAFNSAYASALNDIENREREQSNWERNFAETQKQNEWSRGFQESEAARAQSNADRDYAFNKEQADIAQQNTVWNQNFQQKQADIAQQNTLWNQNFQQNEASRAQANADRDYNFNKEQADIAQQNTVWDQMFRQAQAELAQQNADREYAFQKAQADIAQMNTVWNQNFQQSEADRSQANADRDYNFNREQWQTQVEQWDKQFDYTKMSDDQKLAYNYIVAAAANGGDVSDELLARAGLSRADYNAMKAQAAAAGGGGGGGSTGGNPGGNPGGGLSPDELRSATATAKAATTASVIGVQSAISNAANKTLNNMNPLNSSSKASSGNYWENLYNSAKKKQS